MRYGSESDATAPRLAEASGAFERVIVGADRTSRPARVLVYLACAAGTVGIAIVDHLVEHEISFVLFYLFPVAVAAWMGGRRAGLLFAIASAGLWAAADVVDEHVYSHAAVPYWNAFVRLVYFVLVAELLAQLRKALAHERVQSETDPLTGVFNRLGWYEAAEIEVARARRNSGPIAVAYIDLDNFKAVNDERGHDEGDRVLAVVAETLRASVRRSDVVARVGGDEFIVLLADAAPDPAREISNKLHETLARAMAEHGWPVGFSIGVAAYASPPATVQEIVTRADHTMYAVKHDGKDAVRLVVSD